MENQKLTKEQKAELAELHSMAQSLNHAIARAKAGGMSIHVEVMPVDFKIDDQTVQVPGLLLRVTRTYYTPMKVQTLITEILSGEVG